MPRPRKCRKICHYPQTLHFLPAEGAEGKEPIILTLDEYEAVRLIDKEGMSQEQCGELMNIARTTVQLIYTSARKKLADALVDGLPLTIAGGDYQLCDGRKALCGIDTCIKHQFHQKYGKPKESQVVRIAVPWENGQIFQHFGRSGQFKLYDTLDGTIRAGEILDTSDCAHGALLADILHTLQTDVLICGSIGDCARAAVEAAGIKLRNGISGGADQAVEALLREHVSIHPR